MANHFKRAKPGDIVQARVELPYLAKSIPRLTRGEILDVETPGEVFRVRFNGGRPRVVRADELTMVCRRHAKTPKEKTQ